MSAVTPWARTWRAEVHIVLAGGGTAGHIEPALNLADALRRADPDLAITALGTARGLEVTLVPARGYELALIPAVPLPRGPSRDLLSLPARMMSAVSAAAEVIRRTKADAVVGFGGYVSLPAYFAARRLGVPIVVHEANAKAGLANRIGARFTPHVVETVPGSLPHAVALGLPLRPAIAHLDRAALRDEAAASFGLDPALPTLLVFGGSQGARSLNAAVENSGDSFADAGIQVLQAVGLRNECPPGRSSSPASVALHYIDRMDLAYAAADMALCRSGAMTVAELTAVGLPAAYVPLPIGNGEQRLNAVPVVSAGGGLLVDDADLSADWLVSQLIPLLCNRDRLERASAAAGSLGRPDADQRLVEFVLGAVRSRRGTAV